MPPSSPVSSSPKSPLARKGSEASAQQAASQAFASLSTLSLEPAQTAIPPDQTGRRRLTDSYFIRRDRIAPDPDQPRKLFDEMELAELQASIQSRGIKQPITVRWDATSGCYRIIDGGRRFEAASRLALEELPCWIQSGDAKEVLVDQIVHNWQRSDLRPMETADALVRLRDEFGLSQQQISQMTGKSKGDISKFLKLRDAIIPEVQQQARQQLDDRGASLTKRHLYNIAKLPPDEQTAFASRVQTEQLTALETEQLVQRKMSSKSPTIRRDGLPARQRKLHTSIADVVMTFQRKGFTADDIRTVIRELANQFETVDDSE